MNSFDYRNLQNLLQNSSIPDETPVYLTQPNPWQSHIDSATGNLYYLNTQTGETQPSLPEGVKSAPLVLSKDVLQRNQQYLDTRGPIEPIVAPAPPPGNPPESIIPISHEGVAPSATTQTQAELSNIQTRQLPVDPLERQRQQQMWESMGPIPRGQPQSQSNRQLPVDPLERQRQQQMWENAGAVPKGGNHVEGPYPTSAQHPQYMNAAPRGQPQSQSNRQLPVDPLERQRQQQMWESMGPIPKGISQSNRQLPVDPLERQRQRQHYGVNNAQYPIPQAQTPISTGYPAPPSYPYPTGSQDEHLTQPPDSSQQLVNNIRGSIEGNPQPYDIYANQGQVNVNPQMNPTPQSPLGNRQHPNLYTGQTSHQINSPQAQSLHGYGIAHLQQQQQNQLPIDPLEQTKRGTLASIIDKRSYGIHTFHERSSGNKATPKIIQFAPLITKILIPGLYLNSLHWLLPQGCWLLRYTSVTAPSVGWLSSHMDGTMRIQHDGPNSVKMSGDLYSHVTVDLPWFSPTKEPDPGAGKVPIFKRSDYNSYLKVTSCFFSGQNTLALEFNRHFLDSSNNWLTDTGYRAVMYRQPLPATSPYPHKNRYFAGYVYQYGACVASLTMGWICPQYRDIVLELDSVSASPIPTTSSSGFTWSKLFSDVNFGANVISSDFNLPEASGQSWNSSELHQAMLNNREKDNLDKEWRYHLMFCRGLDMTDRGIMFDNGSTDSNNTPREGAATASHWVFPSGWGNVSGQTFHTTDGYLRTAIHELGHAFNLLHNGSGTNFMRTTPSINGAATPSQPFPTNVSWSFSDADLDRLRHWPDPVIRPGGLEFAAMPYSSIPISDSDDDPILLNSPHFELVISPLLDVVPLGAPVRFKVTCTNKSAKFVPGPQILSLANPDVRGGVSSLNNPQSVNYYSSIFKCNDGCHEEPIAYEPEQSRSGYLTMIRGSGGPLFSSSGMHKVSVEVSWLLDPAVLVEDSNPLPPVKGAHSIPLRFICKAECEVMISPPHNPTEAQYAMKILSCPNVLSAFLFGTPLPKLDRSTRTALTLAMRSPALRSHFAFLRAKWFQAGRAAARGESLNIEEGAILTPAERAKVDSLLTVDGVYPGHGADVVIEESPRSIAPGNEHLILKDVVDE